MCAALNMVAGALPVQIKPFSLLLLTSFYSFGATTLSVSLPPYISNCNGFATATLTWAGAPGPVQIRLLTPTGPPMTAFTGPAGTAITGQWVTSGMAFFLVDQTGAVQATATADFHCGGNPRTIDTGLSGGSWFPLAVGNTWVYKDNSRFSTANYVVWSITGTEQIGGQTYYDLTEIVPGPLPPNPNPPIARLRQDANGIIYQNTAGSDQVYLDPNASLKATYSGPLGTFTNSIQPPSLPTLSQTTSIYVRGIGLANLRMVINEGSDGGLYGNMDLIDVRVDGIHLSLPAPKISLGIEATDFDLTNRLAPNCAIPCYYAACGLGSPVDPPGFYRPCAQVRLDTLPNASGYTVLTQLLNSSNAPVFETTKPLGTIYLQMPLYTVASPIAGIIPTGRLHAHGNNAERHNSPWPHPAFPYISTERRLTACLR